MTKPKKLINITIEHFLRKEEAMAVRVEIRSENVLSGERACIKVYEDDKLVVEVAGQIKMQKGADGDKYPCVFLERQ